MKTSGRGINNYGIWKPCYVVQTISLSTSRQLRSTVILLMGDNEMALISIEWVDRVKECTHLIRPMINSTFLLVLWITVLK